MPPSTTPAPTLEWGVARDHEPTALHRGPMTEQEARTWVQEWEDMAENESARKGMFIVICRQVGPWGATADEIGDESR